MGQEESTQLRCRCVKLWEAWAKAFLEQHIWLNRVWTCAYQNIKGEGKPRETQEWRQTSHAYITHSSLSCSQRCVTGPRGVVTSFRFSTRSPLNGLTQMTRKKTSVIIMMQKAVDGRKCSQTCLMCFESKKARLILPQKQNYYMRSRHDSVMYPSVLQSVEFWHSLTYVQGAQRRFHNFTVRPMCLDMWLRLEPWGLFVFWLVFVYILVNWNH